MAFNHTPYMFVPVQQDFYWFNSTVSFTAATHKFAMVTYAPASGSIDQIEFGTGTVTTGATVEARIETVDSSGDPSGSLVAAGASGTVVVANSDDAVWKTVSIGTPPAVVKGDRIALVLVISSGTPSLALRISSPLISDVTTYTDYYNGSVWAKQAAPIAMTVRYSGSSDYVPFLGLLPARLPTFTSINTGSTPDELGNKITVPFTCTVVGVWVYINSVVGDADLVVYDAANNVLFSKSHLAAQRRTAGVSLTVGADFNVRAGEVVRVVVKPTSVTNVAILQSTESKLTAFSMGSDCVNTSRTDAGVWTEGTDPVGIGLIVERVLSPEQISVGY